MNDEIQLFQQQNIVAHPSLENKDKDIHSMKYPNIKMNNGNLIEENYQEEEEDIQKYQIHSQEDLNWDTMSDNLTHHDHISQINKFDNESEDWYSCILDEE